MPNIPSINPIRDRVGLPVYYRDKRGKLCQFLATSDVVDDLQEAIEDCNDQVTEELINTGEWYKHCTVLAVVTGGKA